MQAIDVVCFIIHVIVGGSIAIIETVFTGSNEMNYIQVGFPSKCVSFVTRNKFILQISQCTRSYTYYQLANSQKLILIKDVVNCVGVLSPQTNFRAD